MAKFTEEQKKNRTRDLYLRRVYGITAEDYHDILDKQHGVCWVCKRKPRPGTNLAVDHAHGHSSYVPKGGIRGLLCPYCNLRVIGKNKDPDLLLQASLYLRQWTGHIAPTRKRRRKRK